MERERSCKEGRWDVFNQAGRDETRVRVRGARRGRERVTPLTLTLTEVQNVLPGVKGPLEEASSEVQEQAGSRRRR